MEDERKKRDEKRKEQNKNKRWGLAEVCHWLPYSGLTSFCSFPLSRLSALSDLLLYLTEMFLARLIYCTADGGSVRFPETSANIYQNTRCKIQIDSQVHTRIRGNLKSHPEGFFSHVISVSVLFVKSSLHSDRYALGLKEFSSNRVGDFFLPSSQE
jgi:hypothetical protein